MRHTAWEAFIHKVSGYFRGRRSEMLRQAFPNIANLTVCDVGGSFHFWEKMPPDLVPKRLVILNIGENSTSGGHVGSIRQAEFILYDGVRMPFGDLEFDVAISNSVIEHVPIEGRAAFVGEIKRIANHYFVQTPAFSFPIEPHFVMPFLHWLPRGLARQLAFVSPWRILSKAPRSLVIDSFEEVHLLRFGELRSYFPEAVVYREKFLGLTKSFTMHGHGGLERRADPMEAPRARSVG